MPTRLPLVFPLLACLFLFFSPRSVSADRTGEWLDMAADARLSLRERQYAAQQLVLADASASTLLSVLKDKNSGGLRRQVAARILGLKNVPDAEAALLEAAFQPDWFLADAAGDALALVYSRLGDPELFTLLRIGSREKNTVPGGAPTGDDWLVLSMATERNQARFRSLVMHGLALKYENRKQPIPWPLTDWIWNGLLDPHVDFRRQAVWAAAVSGSDEAPGKLAAFLYTENNPKLLAAALRALGELRPAEFGEAAERHVGHDDPMVSLEALGALAAMGYPAAMFPGEGGGRSVAGFVLHPSTPVRLRAVELLAGSRNPSALEPLVAALHDRVGANRAAAARALGDLGFTGAIGALSPLLRDGQPEVRTEAAVALHKLGVVGVAAGVLDDLAGEALPFRRAAAATLGRIGDVRAVPALGRSLSDPDLELACSATDSLGLLRDKRGGAALYAALNEAKNPALADAALQALKAIYGGDPGTSAGEREAWARRAGLAGADTAK